MKKTALFLAICMLLSFTSVFAQNDDMSAVLLSVKERLGIGDEYPEFSSTASEDENMTVYSFDWSDSKNQKYHYIHKNNTGTGRRCKKIGYGKTDKEAKNRDQC